jgi:hypothetical protein
MRLPLSIVAFSLPLDQVSEQPGPAATVIA